MSRTSEPDVRKAIDSDTALDLDLYIEAASGLTDYVESCDTDNVLSAGLLRSIETYLAAYFYEARDQGYTEKETGDAKAVFQGRTGMYFEQNKWGQMAITLDISGCLASLQEQAMKGKKQVQMMWLGKPPSEQIDYVDRN